MPVPFLTPIDPIVTRDPSVAIVPPSELLSGDSSTRSWRSFASESGDLRVGIWESEPMSKTKLHPDSMEFCVILEGRVEVADQNGNVAAFGPGDAFVVEPGFAGEWRSLTRVRKYFVVARCR
jgi:uncharacterized cupin superfamily protein